MSNSYRKPYASEKKRKDKNIMHKKQRAMVRTQLASTDDYDEIVLPRKNQEVSNIWDWSQDGAARYEPETPKLKRK